MKGSEDSLFPCNLEEQREASGQVSDVLPDARTAGWAELVTRTLHSWAERQLALPWLLPGRVPRWPWPPCPSCGRNPRAACWCWPRSCSGALDSNRVSNSKSAFAICLNSAADRKGSSSFVMATRRGVVIPRPAFPPGRLVPSLLAVVVCFRQLKTFIIRRASVGIRNYLWFPAILPGIICQIQTGNCVWNEILLETVSCGSY